MNTALLSRFAYAAALAPAIYALFSAWRLRGHSADGGAGPERLMARTQRVGSVFGVVFGFLLVTGPQWPALGVLIAASLVATHYVRRWLFGDTWTLWAHLRTTVGALAAIVGFWILLAVAPALVLMGSTRPAWIAAAIAGLLLAWQQTFALVLRRLMGARPVADPAVGRRFDELAAAFGLSGTTLVEVPIEGSRITNALAVPSPRWPTVVITSTLRQHLAFDEVAAILAHELAHLEHHTVAHLRQGRWLEWILIGVGTGVVPLWDAMGASGASHLATIWPLVIGGLGVYRLVDQRQHEHDSDRRAVAVLGDPEPLERALLTLHRLAGAPRRLDPTLERQSTHPSLARRLQAIRDAAPALPQAASADTAVTCPGLEPGAAVVVRTAELEWVEGGVAARLAYIALDDLRVEVSPGGAAALIAAEHNGRRWRMSIDPASTATLQAALDGVDRHLAHGTPVTTPRLALAALALVTALVASSGNLLAVAVVGLLASAAPAPPLIAAVGATALTTAFATWLYEAAAFHSPWMAVTVLCGLLALGAGVRWRHARTAAHTWALSALVGLAAFTWLAVALEGLDAVGVFRGVRHWMVQAPLAAAVAMLLALTPNRAARFGAIAAGVFGLAGLVAGTTWFVERHAGDPFVIATPPAELFSPDGGLVATREIPFEALELWLSPDGRHQAVRYEDGDEVSLVRIWSEGGAVHDLPALDLEFVDGDRALVLDGGERATSVRLVSVVDPRAPIWERSLTMRASEVTWSAGQARWALVGWAGEDLATASGALDGVVSGVQRWPPPGEAARRPRPIAAATGALMAYTSQRLGDPLPMLTSVLAGQQTQLWTLDAAGRPPVATHTAISCAPHDGPGRAVCAAYDGVVTRLLVIGTDGPGVQPLSQVTGRLSFRGVTGSGFVPASWKGETVAVDLATGALALGSGDQLAVGPTHWAESWHHESSTTIRVHRRSSATAALLDSGRAPSH